MPGQRFLDSIVSIQEVHLFKFEKICFSFFFVWIQLLVDPDDSLYPFVLSPSKLPSNSLPCDSSISETYGFRKPFACAFTCVNVPWMSFCHLLLHLSNLHLVQCDFFCWVSTNWVVWAWWTSTGVAMSLYRSQYALCKSELTALWGAMQCFVGWWNV